jgi:hypothetical protein
MNSKYLLAATPAAFGVGTAAAQEATADTWMKASSTLSRAEVARAVAAARAQGDLDAQREYDIVDPHYRTALKRADVWRTCRCGSAPACLCSSRRRH